MNQYHNTLNKLDDEAVRARLEKLSGKPHGLSILGDLAQQKVVGQERVTQAGGEVEIVKYVPAMIASRVAAAAKDVLRNKRTPSLLDVCADAYPAERTYPEAAWEPSF